MVSLSSLSSLSSMSSLSLFSLSLSLLPHPLIPISYFPLLLPFYPSLSLQVLQVPRILTMPTFEEGEEEGEEGEAAAEGEGSLDPSAAARGGGPSSAGITKAQARRRSFAFWDAAASAGSSGGGGSGSLPPSSSAVQPKLPGPLRAAGGSNGNDGETSAAPMGVIRFNSRNGRLTGGSGSDAGGGGMVRLTGGSEDTEHMLQYAGIVASGDVYHGDGSGGTLLASAPGIEGRSAPNAIRRSVSDTNNSEGDGVSTLDTATMFPGAALASVENYIVAGPAELDEEEASPPSELGTHAAGRPSRTTIQEDIDAARRRYNPAAAKRARRKSMVDFGLVGDVKRNNDMELLAASARFRSRHSADRLPYLGSQLSAAAAAAALAERERASQESRCSSGVTSLASGSHARLQKRGSMKSDSMRLDM